MGYFLILLCQDLVLKLSIQAQALKSVIQNQFKKGYFKDLTFFKEYPQKFIKNVP